MAAIVVRRDRYGEPMQAMREEEVPVPEIGPDDVLVGVAAAGINYNNVWAARGRPLDIIGMRLRRGSTHDFHVGGSEAAGIVQQVGSNVANVRVGDEVVIQGGVWDESDPFIREGGDPILSGSFRAWGYETNWGSFAQFCRVKKYQCLPRPQNLSWEESAVFMLCGATCRRMLFHWEPNTLQRGEAVLIWGGAGGLGVMGIQLARLAGALPVAVVNSEEKREFCVKLGAVGAINRSNYDHWGFQPSEDSTPDEFDSWKKSAMAFRNEITAMTDGRAPSIVLEHPGASTMPTSLFACRPGGMVVTCGGTSGYAGSFDLRYLWIFQKRIQGSHFASLDECRYVNELAMSGDIKPVLSEVFSFSDIPKAHQLMAENKHSWGNMAARIAQI